MSHAVADIIIRVVGRAIHLLAEDEAASADLHELTIALQEGVNKLHPQQKSEAEEVILPSVSVAEAEPPNVTPLEPAATEVIERPETEVKVADELPGLQSNDERSARRPPVIVPTFNEDLPEIEERCRLKAEAARWAIERRALLERGADFQNEIAPINRELILKGQEKDCLLWMLLSTWHMPDDASLMENVEVGFLATSDALSVVQMVLADRSLDGFFEQALELLVEAQCVLRCTVEQVNSRSDVDQTAIFSWLMRTTADQQIRLPRFMRIDDAADPTHSSDLTARIAGLRGELEARKNVARLRKRLLGKVRHLVEELTKENGDAHEHWKTVIGSVDELVASGLPPSNKELREALLPVIDDLPCFEDMPNGFVLVQREIERVASRQEAPEGIKTAEPSLAVKAVRTLLENRTIVFIGGDARPEAKERLKRAFGLSDVNWIATSGTESVERFRAAVNRPEVALVILALRWSRYGWGEVQRLCEEAGKPFVRLPAGYNPNQIAAQVLTQCGDRLRFQASRK